MRLLFPVVFALLIMMLASCGSHNTQAEQTPTESATKPTTNTTIDANENDSFENGSLETSNGKLGTAQSDRPDHESENGSELDADIDNVGVINGDVYYKGIAISTLLLIEEHPETILGMPLRSSSEDCGPFLFYEGLEITYDDYMEFSVLQVQFTDLSLFEIDGVSLDKSQEELIAAFGAPIEYYVYRFYEYRNTGSGHSVRYHVTSDIVDYVLEFWFENPEDKAYICRAFRIYQ